VAKGWLSVADRAIAPDRSSVPSDSATALGRRRRPAFYAAAPGNAARDWWTLLHPPYTAWHLGYVVIGACLAPTPEVPNLLATLAAFFLAVGVGAHALDELHGRPLRTNIPGPVLTGVAAVSLAGAATLGCIGIARIGVALVPFIVAGVGLVVGYNLELFGGRLHNDAVFALAWGSFPVLVGYLAEAGTFRPAALLAAAAAFALSWAQRALSTPARLVRRSSERVEGTVTMTDGSRRQFDERWLLVPVERALSGLSVAVVLLAAALAVGRMT
jgi:hypothetical protein